MCSIFSYLNLSLNARALNLNILFYFGNVASMLSSFSIIIWKNDSPEASVSVEIPTEQTASRLKSVVTLLLTMFMVIQDPIYSEIISIQCKQTKIDQCIIVVSK